MSKQKLTNDDMRDIAIRVADELVLQGIIPNDMDTDNDNEFRVQDIVHTILSKTFNIEME